MTKRQLELDVLRGIAVMLVVTYHIKYVQPVDHPFFQFLIRGGWSGVNLFFALSGFLVGGLLFREYRDRQKVDVWRFLARRGFKIYPSFWLLVIASAFIPLAGKLPTLPQVAEELFYIQNYAGGYLDNTWSLAIEEHFYLILALLVWLYAAKGGSNPFRSLPFIGVVVSLAVLFMRVVVAQRNPTFTWDIHYTPTHIRIDGLFIGAVIAYFDTFFKERFTAFVKKYRFVLLLVGIAGLFPAFYRNVENPRFCAWLFSLIAIGSAALVMATLAIRLPRWFSPLGLIGKYSYNIYLWHGSMVGFFIPLIKGYLPWLGSWIILVYLVGSVLLGIGMSAAVEQPFLVLRDRLFPSHPHPKPAAIPEGEFPSSSALN
jgi:peptidoglycan/LPS O-acetylase OafA/YrhL